MFAIYKRELRSYFVTPIGYIFCGMFLLVSGLLFYFTTLANQSTASLSEYFFYMILMFAILIPLLTMKLFAEDRRTKTEQLLLTAPVSLTGMVMGKYLAALTIYGCTFIANIFNFVLLYMYGTPNTGSIVANILGVFLIGAAFVAVGLFLSSLTQNQLIAAVSSIGAIVAMLLVSLVIDSIPFAWLQGILEWFSILDRYVPFMNQALSIPAVMYYFSLAAVFVFLTVRVYDKRRWS
ncbi:MAG: ABC transporter permease [Clostridia bacterium]|jgi:ABC-2 type transport system permease protein|nr:ABC transporter permease [Clostridia bacterium]MBO7157447.1 ABC transporter permease [Clostridia bacterium]